MTHPGAKTNPTFFRRHNGSVTSRHLYLDNGENSFEVSLYVRNMTKSGINEIFIGILIKSSPIILAYEMKLGAAFFRRVFVLIFRKRKQIALSLNIRHFK